MMFSKQLSENKMLDIQLANWHNPSIDIGLHLHIHKWFLYIDIGLLLFKISIEAKLKGDHTGIYIRLSSLGRYLDFDFYDIRHCF